MKQLKLIFTLSLLSYLLNAQTGTINLLATQYNIPNGQNIGSVNLSWNATNYPYTQIWVKGENGTEKIIMGSYQTGSCTPNWMIKDKKYTFKLYSATGAGTDTTKKGVLLKEITVPEANITAKNYVIPDGQTLGSVDLSWNVTGYSYTIMYVVGSDGIEKDMAGAGQSGTYTPTWIKKGQKYTFRLYSATGPNDARLKDVFLKEITIPEGNLIATDYNMPNGQTIGSVKLSWAATGYSGTLLYVVDENDVEKCVTGALQSGTTNISWMIKDKKYKFRLYGTTTPYDITKKGILLKEITTPDGKISATNYNIPSGKTIGSVDLSWTATGYSYTMLYVIGSDGIEKLMTETGQTGTGTPTWIKKGEKYTFRLYGATGLNDITKKGTLLNEITIPEGEIEAGMYAIPVEGTSAPAYLNWTATGYSNVQLWLQEKDKTETYITTVPQSGTYTLNGIKKGISYTLKLYGAKSAAIDETMKGDLLDQKIIAGITPAQKVIGVNKFNLLIQYMGTSSNSKINDINKKLAKNSIADAKELGFTFMRVAVSMYDSTSLKIWENEPTRFWAAVDEMFADLKANNMNIVPSLNWNVNQFPNAYNNSIKDFFTNQNCLSKQKLKQFITDFVGRCKNNIDKNNTVLFWELHNEADLFLDVNNSTISTDDFVIHSKWMCNEIRQIDPFHMITSGNSQHYTQAWHVWKYKTIIEDTYEQYKEVIYQQNRYCDIVSAHVYGFKSNLGAVLRDNERFSHTGEYNFDYITDMYTAVKGMNKILYIGEFGDSEAVIKDITTKIWGGNSEWLGNWITNNTYPKSIAVLEQIKKNKINFSSPWCWEFYQFSLHDEVGDGFGIDPAFSKPLIDKMIDVNYELGNAKWTAQQTDITKPKCIITYPLNNSTCTYNTFVWTNASDNNRIINKIELWIDGVFINSTNSFPFRNKLDFNTLSEAKHNIEIRVYDLSGNYSTDNISIYYVKPIPPTATQSTNGIILTWKSCYVGTVYGIERYDNVSKKWIGIHYSNYGGSFTDTNVNKDSIYRYRLQTETSGGNFISESIVVTKLKSGVAENLSETISYTTQVDDENNTANSPITINPTVTTGLVTINGISDGNIVTVFNNTGKQITQFSVNSSSQCVDLSGNTDGLYIINVVEKNRQESFKIILNAKK